MAHRSLGVAVRTHAVAQDRPAAGAELGGGSSHRPSGRIWDEGGLVKEATLWAVELAFRLLDHGARIPGPAHEGDAGLDLAANEDLILGPGERAVVATGLAVAVPPGHAGLVLPRSGLASRHGITLANAPGLIDAGYRGEVKVALVNLDRSTPFEIRRGDRIAQLVVVAFAPARPVEVGELPPSERGEGGFGSTGTSPRG